MSTSAMLDEHIRWIKHKNRELLTIHFRGQTEAQMVQTIDHMGKVMSDGPDKVRVLIDLRDATLSSVFMSRVKQLGKEVFELKCERRAFIGITGLKLIFVQAYNRFTGSDKNFQVFETEQAALDWLAS
jgi:hypothetical protein